MLLHCRHRIIARFPLPKDRPEGVKIPLAVVIVLDRENDRHHLPSMRKRSMETPRDFHRALAERTTAPS